MAVQNSLNATAGGIIYHDGNGVFTGNNLQAATNTISSTDANGDIILSPNGTGGVVAVTDLTVGNSSKDVSFTINGSAISGTISAEGLDSTDLGGLISHRHSATAGFGGHFIGLRSRGSHASPTIVSDDDTLSIFATAGYDGTDYAQAAQITVEVDGTPGANDMPARLVFLTSADGGQTPTEALRITSGQDVGINTAAPLDTLHITGSTRLTHTATEADDHALEIDCDAAGFGDVKGIDIDYISGAIGGTDDEEAILLNIDETASTGGIINGYEVLATAEGSATINGYTTGINVNPVVHESGTFGDADNILNKAVDVTAALASGGAGNISIFVADNDTFTIGDASTWDEFEIILGTGASGSGVAPTFEYSTGGAAYSAFSPADGTNGFRNTGAILWDSAQLTGWATATSGDYEIRITRTRNSLSTTPIIDELQISSTTEYSWDKDGALTVNSLALTTDLSVANGGTGASTLTGVLTGNGTSAITANAVTQYGTVIAGASNAVSSVAPSATTGVPFISQGASANPAYGTAVVAGGGTGRATHTAYGVICGGTTTTAAQQSIASVGTAAQVLTSNGAGALPTFQAAAGGGGAWTFLNTQTASTSATIEITSDISSTYNTYLIMIYGVQPDVTNKTLYMRISDDGGSTWEQAAGDYRYAVTGTTQASGALNNGVTTATLINLHPGASCGADAGEDSFIQIYMHSPADSGVPTSFNWHMMVSNSANHTVNEVGAGKFLTSSAVDGVQFYYSSDNIEAGKFSMWGLDE